MQQSLLKILCPLAQRAMGVIIGIIVAGALSAPAIADSSFPFGKDLILDVAPMKGSKRIPVVEIDEDGAAIIDLWCDRVQGRAIVAGSTLTITPVARAGATCSPERAQADEDVIDALQQVTGWRRTGTSVVLVGPRSLNFRLPTN